MVAQAAGDLVSFRGDNGEELQALSLAATQRVPATARVALLEVLLWGPSQTPACLLRGPFMYADFPLPSGIGPIKAGPLNGQSYEQCFGRFVNGLCYST